MLKKLLKHKFLQIRLYDRTKVIYCCLHLASIHRLDKSHLYPCSLIFRGCSKEKFSRLNAFTLQYPNYYGFFFLYIFNTRAEILKCKSTEHSFFFLFSFFSCVSCSLFVWKTKSKVVFLSLKASRYEKIHG